MPTVKSTNKIIEICFSARTFQLKVDQCYPIFHWSWNFWELFSLISFLKNFSRMKRSWQEELQLPVTIKRSFLSRLCCSYTWKKMFERYRQLRLLPKQILCQSHFMFQIIFTKRIWLANSFKCFSHRNVWPLRQRAEIRERIAFESLKKTRMKFYEVVGYVRVDLKLYSQSAYVRYFEVIYCKQGSRTQYCSQD